jgi:hypothetical protein
MLLTTQRRDQLRLLIVLLIGTCAWATTFWKIGWFWDDYHDVYGLPTRPIPTFYQMICDAGLGVELDHPTIERILALPFCGYLGLWLGPVGCHLLMGLMHLGVGAMFYALLRQLAWSSSEAAWAAALFLVSPWINEPVFWWTASTLATPCTLLGLAAAMVYLRSSRGGGLLRLSSTLLITFACNCWYELWLGLPILFLGLEIYQRRHDADRAGHRLIESLRQCWPTFLSGLLWAFLAHLSFPFRHPWFPPRRWIPVFLSLQLRVYNWIAGTPWRSALHDGLATLVTPVGILLLLLTAGAVALYLTATPQLEDDSTPIPLLPALLLGWMWFMSARVILLLQGGIDLDTRHNYPANMGCMLAFVAVFSALRRRFGLGEWTTRLILGTTLLVCMITTAGIGKQYIEIALENR